MNCYQPNYPRPQFTRDARSWENLNGQWDFASDDSGAGIKERWNEKFPQGKTIQGNIPSRTK
jgi:hypothetical protein